MQRRRSTSSTDGLNRRYNRRLPRSLVSSTFFTLIALSCASVSRAQQAEPATRQAVIEQAQAEKSKALHTYVTSGGERVAARIESALAGERGHLHPFFESAYSGGGFAFGAGYFQHVSAFNFVDIRGSYSVANYKRAEIEYVAPRLFHRRGELSLLAGWRDATQVGFHGTGINSPEDARANYRVTRPYASALLTVRPTRRNVLLRGGVEWTRWSQEPGRGQFPSVDSVFTPETLPGLGSNATYVHAQATTAFDWRPSPGYARRGGYYGITAHDYKDRAELSGFRQVDYELIQHFPIVREAWVVSFRARATTTMDKNGEQIPFFMLPALGGSSTLRGYSSWRFRDRNTLLLQGEWRIMASRFLDSAVFYDAGTVAARRADLNLADMKHDFGFGIRFHGPISTPLRAELAKGSEGLVFVISTSAAF